MAQHGRLLTSGPALYVNINADYEQIKIQQPLIFIVFNCLNTKKCIFYFTLYHWMPVNVTHRAFKSQVLVEITQ